jgi:hypothetical protein
MRRLALQRGLHLAGDDQLLLHVHASLSHALAKEGLQKTFQGIDRSIAQGLPGLCQGYATSPSSEAGGAIPTALNLVSERNPYNVQSCLIRCGYCCSWE